MTVRPLTAADAELFAEHIAGDLEHLSEFLGWPALTATSDGAREWLAKYDACLDGRKLVIGDEREGRLVGGAVLISYSAENKVAELGCWAVLEGRRVASTLCREVLRVARQELGVERVAWQCDSQNWRSRRLGEHLGFRLEGTLRSSYVLRGERRDLDVLSMVGTELDR